MIVKCKTISNHLQQISKKVTYKAHATTSLVLLVPYNKLEADIECCVTSLSGCVWSCSVESRLKLALRCVMQALNVLLKGCCLQVIVTESSWVLLSHGDEKAENAHPTLKHEL